MGGLHAYTEDGTEIWPAGGHNAAGGRGGAIIGSAAGAAAGTALATHDWDGEHDVHRHESHHHEPGREVVYVVREPDQKHYKHKKKGKKCPPGHRMQGRC